ncbi:MAG: hypothetical protein ABL967_19190 [Bryobacteraceae bacterium]
MAPSTNKKVIVTRFQREPVAGFVQTPDGFTEDAVEVITPSGSLVQLLYSEVKVVSFVKEFDEANAWQANRHFASRPKTPGLWVRLRFTDGDSVEGLIPNNLMAVEANGFQITPPDPTFQNQRIFVPRAAVTEVQVLGVVGSPLTRKKAKTASPTEGQLEMF